MKKTVVGLLALLLAFLTGCNTITPLVSETILNSYSAKAQIGAGDRTQSDNTFSKDEQSNQNGSVEKESASDAKEAAFDDGKILIYNFEQLSMIGSGKSYKYSDGVSATYSMDAEYKLARDIPIPRHTLWQLPEGFKGKISGEKQEYAPLYENASDSLYLYNPYQLATMAMDNAAQQTVLSGDSEAKTFGTGQPVCIDENSKAVLTYSDEHNYVVSAQFDSDMTKKPVSILIGKESEEPLGANAFVPLGAKADSSVGAGTDDGRDFQGQVIKNINGTPHILIGNEDQLRAIGTDKDVYSAIYQVKLVGAHFEIDTSGGNPIMLYGGDADLLGTQNGKTDYGFQSIDNKDSNALKYYASVNQNTNEINLDSSHTSLTKSSQITTGKKYSVSENYIIFRDINLGDSARPWKPLMFTGTMHGAKSANGEKLWNGSGIADSTALTATAEINRPNISNVYVNTDSIYSNHKLRVNDFIGVGFFATVTNKASSSDIGLSGGTAVVKNIDLNNVHVENNANDAVVDETILDTLTKTLGSIVGGVVDLFCCL